ncbi:MAG TPA: SRPBCC domain-containing protein [Flavipsychrobacter sp.]|nr:SRPBCC domain-containing protein [Flavipsychrobacter sp.]
MDQDLFVVSPECEILSSRLFRYPRTSMFRAWTEPGLLAKWWGPKGFSNTFHQFDLRPGGTWKFTMHGPEKGNYQNECVFCAIEEPKLIAWNRLSQPIFRVVATFDETPDGDTFLSFSMQFKTKEECDKIRKFAPDKNEENFDKLERVLTEMM